MRKILRPAAGLLAAVMLLSSCGSEPVKIRDDELFTPDVSDCADGGLIELDPSEVHQTIQGFGGINYPGWIDDLTEDQRKTAFLNGDDQLGFTILRIHVDPDPNNWEKEIPTAKYAQKQGALIFASPWNPPDDMCERFDKADDPDAKRLQHDKYADYAKHLNDFVTFMRDNGVELYAISIQNEPDYAAEWTWWTTDEIMDFIKNYSDQIDCKIMSPEAFQYKKNFYDAILNDPDALSKIDIFGTHFYGTQKSDMAYPLFEEKGEGKELWMTEVYVPNSDSDADTYPEALQVAMNIHNAMTTGNMQAYVWWYIRRFYSPMKEDGTVSKRGYMMAHYSKYVRPGSVRIGATESPASGILCSAYSDSGNVVAVLINSSDTKYSEKISLKGGSEIGYIETYQTDGTKNLERTGNISHDGKEFTVVMEPKSAMTVVIELAE